MRPQLLVALQSTGAFALAARRDLSIDAPRSVRGHRLLLREIRIRDAARGPTSSPDTAPNVQLLSPGHSSPVSQDA